MLFFAVFHFLCTQSPKCTFLKCFIITLTSFSFLIFFSFSFPLQIYFYFEHFQIYFEISFRIWNVFPSFSFLYQCHLLCFFFMSGSLVYIKKQYSHLIGQLYIPRKLIGMHHQKWSCGFKDVFKIQQTSIQIHSEPLKFEWSIFAQTHKAQ